ncbi:hypothetical protein Poly41_56710 [Novipirellula artificiosorum]|uniref:Uncharacterized protein n=1 Tax=Novipirellula artificiosorum TaxID=2528016 RepID=A0A5C6DAC1_9BACT|nr:hypothetical protein Poly41_56710 [Novipirellula artificiosorum]
MNHKRMQRRRHLKSTRQARWIPEPGIARAAKPQSAPWVTARVPSQTLKGFYKRTHRGSIVMSVGVDVFVEHLRRTDTLIVTGTQGAPLRVDPGLWNRTALR